MKIHLSISMICILLIPVVTLGQISEPTHEFEKPGTNSGHSYDALVPEESVDLFTGGLILRQRDIPGRNLKAFDDFWPLVTRSYTSKIFRQDSASSTCNPMAMSVEDEFVGLGWNIHFGRLWDYSSSNPVLELPDLSRHMFYPDSSAPSAYPDQRISKSLWILRSFVDSGQIYYEASSPGPEMIKLLFYVRTVETRGARSLLHAEFWSLYKGTGTPVTTNITYAKVASTGRFVPKSAVEGCGATSRQAIDFNVDITTGTLTSINVSSPLGTAAYSYTYISRNGHRLLSRFRTPEGRNYLYDYDSNTNELVKMRVSTDSGFGANDLEIQYAYSSKQFYSNPDFVNKACARVITQKKVRDLLGAYDSYSYEYPSSSSTTHAVTVTDPRGHRRQVTFQGYANIGDSVWRVGSTLKEEMFNGCCSSLISDQYSYGFVQITTALDPETNSLDSVKIPVLLQKTRTFTQTNQQAVTLFGTQSDYDRFGNPSFKIEKNFNGTIQRRTDFKYEYEDGDSDDANMMLNHFVRAISSTKVVNGSNQRMNETNYVYHNTVSSRNFGLMKDSLVWDSATGATIRKTFTYDSFRQLSELSEQSDSSDRKTSFTTSCGMTLSVNDSLSSIAGPIFAATLMDDVWLYEQTFDANGRFTLYDYDKELRLVKMIPPSGDQFNISYDDHLRKVERQQGTAQSIDTYDRQGRLQARQTRIEGGIYSYQRFEQDVASNVIQTSESSFSSSPNAYVVRTFDALNRLTSVRTEDGLIEFIFDGPDVTRRMYDGTRRIETDFTYDAFGRLISVREPNNKTTNYSYDALDRLIAVDQGTEDRSFAYSSRGLLLSETHPESGTTTYTYDLLGRLKTKKYAGSSVITYSYDLRDRITKIDYQNDVDKLFYYDGTSVPGKTRIYTNPKSQLTGMSDASGITLWPAFNDLAQLTQREIYWTGFANPVSLEYSYDSRGNLAAINYPSGQTIGFLNNDGNGVEKITRQHGSSPISMIVPSISYNPALLPSSIEYGNGLQVEITPDARNRPSIIDATNRLRLEYRYNERGLIDLIKSGKNSTGLKNRSFVYDDMGRLTQLDSTLISESVFYGWDEYGNLSNKSGGIASTYTYTNNQIDGINYSPSGNQLEANGLNLSYNQENRLSQVSAANASVSYVYDGKGNRVKSVDNLTGQVHFFVYDESNALLSELSQDSSGFLYIDKEYVYGPTGTLSTINYQETVRGLSAFNLSDRVRIHWRPLAGCSVSGVRVYRSIATGGPYELLTGDTCLNTSHFYDDINVSNGTKYYYIVKSVGTDGSEYSSPEIAHTFSVSNSNPDGPMANYEAAPLYYHLNDHLGTTRSVTNKSGQEIGFFEYFPFGEPLVTTGCSVNKQRFTGKPLDVESGLQYFGARHLSNHLTRFTSVDPVSSSLEPSNPQSLNRYSYSFNSPQNFFDPDGKQSSEVELLTKQRPPGAELLESQLTLLGVLPLITGEIVQAGVGFLEAAYTLLSSVSITASTAVTGSATLGTQNAQKVGKLGEQLAGIIKNTRRIESVTSTARYRIPDFLNEEVIGEVKNVNRLSFTSQLKDFYFYAQQNNLQFQLHVRQNTTFTSPLNVEVDKGRILIIKSLP